MDEHAPDPPRRHDDGRRVYVVGPVERWIIGIAASVVVGLLYAYGSSVTNKLDEVNATSTRIEISQAVSSNDISELKAKQALMAAEVAKIPRLEIQALNNAQNIRDLRESKGLK